MFSELKKDAVGALELILQDPSLDFVAIRGLLPLMSDYQLDLLNDKVSYIYIIALWLINELSAYLYSRIL